MVAFLSLMRKCYKFALSEVGIFGQKEENFEKKEKGEKTDGRNCVFSYNEKVRNKAKMICFVARKVSPLTNFGEFCQKEEKKSLHNLNIKNFEKSIDFCHLV